MTREELEKKAKESFNNKLQKDVCYCTYNKEKIYKDGYIAGAKANKPKWHKVADGDIPLDRYKVLSEKGHIVLMKDMKWFEFSPNYDDIPLRSWEQPKYWCDIPKFEVKEC